MRETHTNNPIDAKCREQQISRRELCRRAGLNCRTVESWCAGHRKNPNVYQLYRVALVLGSSIEELLDPDLCREISDELTAASAERPAPEK